MSAGRGRYVAWFVGVALVFSAGLLVNLPIPPQFEKWRCVNDVELGGPFRLIMICDSWLFMDLAHRPSRLLEPRNLRQSRPGIVFAAALPAKLLAIPFGENRFTSYAAYMIVHAAIMLACLAIFLAIVEPRVPGPAPAVVAASLLLLFNTVTRDFLLSPITCLLHLLAPLFCLAVARAAWWRDLFSSGRVFGLALLAGLGFTAYGSLVLFLPAVVLPAAVRAAQRGAPVLPFLRRAAAVTAIVVAPIALWYAFVLAWTGAVYHPEIEIYRNWIWMLDAYLAQGAWPVVTKLGALAGLYARHFVWYAAPPVVLAAAVLVLAPPPRGRWVRAVLPEVGPAVFVALLFAVFFITSNYIPPRTVFSATVPLVVVAGSLAALVDRSEADARRRRLGWLVLAATLVFGFMPIFWNVRAALQAGPGAW
jgi:hypothetical protein